MPGSLELDAYLQRIGLDRQPSRDLEGLTAIHAGHVTHIPFENLQIHLGLGMTLELDQMQELMVRGRRGGYCFQMNGLLAACLKELGFDHDLLAARVWLNCEEVPAASHELLLVRLGGRSYLADVGFGGGGLMRPVPLDERNPFDQHGLTFRLSDAGAHGFMLQRLEGNEWVDLYSFTLTPRFPIDFKHSNYYLSTAPESLFVQNVNCSIVTVRGFRSLFNQTLKVWEDGVVVERRIDPGGDYLQALKREFGIDLCDQGADLRLPPASRMGP